MAEPPPISDEVNELMRHSFVSSTMRNFDGFTLRWMIWFAWQVAIEYRMLCMVIRILLRSRMGFAESNWGPTPSPLQASLQSINGRGSMLVFVAEV